jgi:hypothetical protein
MDVVGQPVSQTMGRAVVTTEAGRTSATPNRFGALLRLSSVVNFGDKVGLLKLGNSRF